MAILEITDDPFDYDVGDLGEIEFERWCVKANIVANRAQRDRKGWDFIIELQASDPRFQHDEITAKVQVKATKSGAESARIKLDNLSRMATDPAPWFVLYFEFDAAANIVSAHLVHVDEKFVANAHRVVRAEQPSTLHKRKIKLAWSDEDRLDPAEALELLRRIREAVGGSLWSYYDRKGKWNTVALQRRVAGSLEFPGTRDKVFEMLADLAIGLLDELPANLTEIVDTETGASGVPAGAMIESSVITIERRAAAPVKLEVSYGIERVVLNCGMYTSAVFTHLPVEHHKLRFFNELLSVVLGAHGLFMRVDIPSKAVPLAILAQTARVVRLLANPGADLTVRGEGFTDTITVTGAQLREKLGRGGAEPLDAVAWERAAWLGNHLGLPHDLEVQPSILLAQRDQIDLLHMLLDRTRRPSAFRVELHDKTMPTSGDAAMVIVPKVALADYGCVAIGAALGPATVSRGEFTIEHPELEVLRVEARHRHELTSAYFEEALTAAVSTLKARKIPIVRLISAAELKVEG